MTRPPCAGKHVVAADDIERFIDAVVRRDPVKVARLLNPLSRLDLEAITILLADRLRQPVETPAERAELPDELLGNVVKAAALCFKLDTAVIYSPARRRDITDARQVACYVARLLGFRFTAIGAHIGRDHSTVYNGCVRVGEDRRLREVATHIAEALGWDREAAA